MAEPMTTEQEAGLRKRCSSDMKAALATVDDLRARLAEETRARASEPAELRRSMDREEALRAEVERLRKACAELAALKQGAYDCSGCGRPCYESDLAADGYLCSRCCPHEAEIERDDLRARLDEARTLAARNEQREAEANDLATERDDLHAEIERLREDLHAERMASRGAVMTERCGYCEAETVAGVCPRCLSPADVAATLRERDDLRSRLAETEREASAERDARWANHAALADLDEVGRLLATVDNLRADLAEAWRERNDARSTLAAVREALDSAHTTMCADARDWSTDRRDAWLYGLVVGWDGPAMREVSKRHRLDAERLSRLHAAVRVVADVKGGTDGE